MENAPPTEKDIVESLILQLEDATDKDPFLELLIDEKEEPIKPKNQRKERKRRGKGREEGKEESTDQKKPPRENYTHFFSLPLHTAEFKQKALDVMKNILSKVDEAAQPFFRKQDMNKIHVTLSMLALKDEETQKKVAEVFKAKEKDILALFEDKTFHLTFDKIGAFWDRGRGKRRMPRVIYLEIKNDENFVKLNKLCHTLISEMLAHDVIKESDLKKMNLSLHKGTQMYRPTNYHVTLFRLKKNKKLEGVNFRTIMKECEDLEFGTFPINRVDVSTRFKFDSDKFYMPLSSISLTSLTAQPQIVISENMDVAQSS